MLHDVDKDDRSQMSQLVTGKKRQTTTAKGENNFQRKGAWEEQR